MSETRITSRKNPTLQRVRRLLSSRREREEAGLFAGEGTKLLSEAAQWGQVELAVLAEGVEVALSPEIPVLRVSGELFASLSGQESPQGAVFLCRKPENPPFVPRPGMLLLDGIQDPGNLGTILRTADAFQVEVALLEGCADPYGPKTVRASMGAVFRKTPVICGWDQARDACRAAGIPLGVTALGVDAQDIRQAPLGQMAVVIGSEGRGVRPELIRQADRLLVIPMQPNCESLNAAAAAAIIAWQMVQR